MSLLNAYLAVRAGIAEALINCFWVKGPFFSSIDKSFFPETGISSSAMHYPLARFVIPL